MSQRKTNFRSSAQDLKDYIELLHCKGTGGACPKLSSSAYPSLASFSLLCIGV